jgi:amino acid adenylation domain-containing protein
VKLSEFHLLDETGDHDRLVPLWRQVNETQAPYPKDKTVPGVFEGQAATTPAATAVIHGDLQVSYRELDHRSNQLARFLIDRQLQPETLVAILLDRAPAMIVAMLGAMKAGGAYLPVSHELPFDHIKRMLCHSRAPILIAKSHHRDLCRRLQTQCPDLKQLLFLVEENDEPLARSTDSTEFDSTALHAYSGAPSVDCSRPGSLAYVIYTSGTTGVPKGVMVEHHAILRLVLNTNYIELSAADRILQTGSLAFDASTFEIWGALLNGGCVCLPDRDALLDGVELARLIRQHQITTLFLTTGLFNALASNDVAVFSGLKTLLTGGERASPQHFNRVRQAHPELILKHLYGPTENTTLTTCYTVQQDFETAVPIGSPISNTTVYILDEKLEPVDIGIPGELYTGGDGLARGYFHDPALTAQKFIHHPLVPGERLYRTGDLACWRADGTIDFLGRIDDQVKLRGYRIDPGEIEAWLLQHERLKEALVLARTGSDGDRHLVAYYTAQGQVDSAELRHHLCQQLPDYMVPTAFVQLKELPLTHHGKVNRTALPDPEQSRRGIGPTNNRPLSATEAELITIWQEALCQPDIGVADNFFDLGGHSLRAVKLMYLIHQRLDVLLPFTVIFEAPTVGALAARVLDAIRFGHQSIDQPMVSLNTSREGSTIFAFPPGTGDALGYGELAKRLDPLGFYAFNFIESETRIPEYVDLILKVDGDGPYVLFGYSGGGNLAFRTVGELERRGKRVNDVVMLDSSRFLQTFRFPVEEARRLALEFVGAEGVQAYVDNPVLKDKLIRMIERYYETLARKPDDALIDANIHVIISENSQDEYRDDGGRLICSKSGWAAVTRNVFRIYQGSGEHGRMLHQPYLAANAALLRTIFESIFAGEWVAG